jgi:putative iron-only hydrogenase system regulator
MEKRSKSPEPSPQRGAGLFFQKGTSMERRLGVVGIVIEDRKKAAPQVNQILSEHGEIIAGRMGLPYRGRNVSVIALIVDGTTDEIGSLSGKLGMLKGVQVCSSLIRK